MFCYLTRVTFPLYFQRAAKKHHTVRTTTSDCSDNADCCDTSVFCITPTTPAYRTILSHEFTRVSPITSERYDTLICAKFESIYNLPFAFNRICFISNGHSLIAFIYYDKLSFFIFDKYIKNEILLSLDLVYTRRHIYFYLITF